MIEAMRDSYDTVKAILGRYDIAAEDAREVLEIVRGLCYRWAEANAVGCLEDEHLRERLSTADYNAVICDYMSNAKYIHEKLLATFPPEWVDEIRDLDGPEEPGDLMGEEEMYQ